MHLMAMLLKRQQTCWSEFTLSLTVTLAAALHRGHRAILAEQRNFCTLQGHCVVWCL